MTTYFIDYDNNTNWARIGCLKPGQRCHVFVRQQEDPSASPILAIGTRTGENEFTVTFDNECFEGFEMTYESLMDTLNLARTKRTK